MIPLPKLKKKNITRFPKKTVVYLKTIVYFTFGIPMCFRNLKLTLKARIK